MNETAPQSSVHFEFGHFVGYIKFMDEVGKEERMSGPLGEMGDLDRVCF